MNRRRNDGWRGLAMVGSIVAVGALFAAAPNPAWHDARMPQAERALLAETEGFVLPTLDGVEWVGDAPTEADLAGKVVVIQSWTHAGSRDRAIVRRVNSMIKRSGRGDDVTLITLHTPKDAERAREYIERTPTGGFSAIDVDGVLCDTLGIWQKPTMIIVDRSGTIQTAGASVPKIVQIIRTLADESAGERGETLPSRQTRDELANRGSADGGDVKPDVAGGAQFPSINTPVKNGTDLRGKKGPDLFVQQWISKPPMIDNKVIMVEFWATWCGPCVRGIPHLNELAAAHRDELVVVGLSNESVSTINQFMRKTRMDYHVASDQSQKMTRMTKHTGIPHAIVMSPDGIVRWQGHPASLTDAIMTQIISASNIVGGNSAASGAGTMRWSTD